MSTPHRCPVCEGTGLVPVGFYRAIGTPDYTTSNAAPEQCRSCGGQGIVWADEASISVAIQNGSISFTDAIRLMQ